MASTIKGRSNAKRLLEDLPNKIQNTLGIVSVLICWKTTAKRILRLVTLLYEMLVTYHGECHLRSGTTKQVRKGNAMQQFFLKRLGKTFDDVVEHKAIRMT